MLSESSCLLVAAACDSSCCCHHQQGPTCSQRAPVCLWLQHVTALAVATINKGPRALRELLFACGCSMRQLLLLPPSTRAHVLSESSCLLVAAACDSSCCCHHQQGPTCSERALVCLWLQHVTALAVATINKGPRALRELLFACGCSM